ncbi:uncharacterized protein LOC124287714 [Haliotis rubra]|uniref:uncharacterized protein LOC124287714 n=1 Tax=Haliotis rubra TaxID=36100 RepID=UPI001EE55B64|nr:uncharacterized protein LOC124287714 [Haliotis rubra]
MRQETGVDDSRTMQCKQLTLLSVFCLCLRRSVVYCTCQYKDHWVHGSYQIPTTDNQYSKELSEISLYECMASCFTHTEACRSFNYWTNSSVCQFFEKSLSDNDNKEEGTNVHAIYTDMATMPQEMSDVVGGCSFITCSESCYLDRNNRPRCKLPAAGMAVDY